MFVTLHVVMYVYMYHAIYISHLEKPTKVLRIIMQFASAQVLDFCVKIIIILIIIVIIIIMILIMMIKIKIIIVISYDYPKSNNLPI